MDYNYREAVKADTLGALMNEYGTKADISKAIAEMGADAFVEQWNDDLWIDDAVTGNGSGSYWCSTYKAESALAHNWELLRECAEAFGMDAVVDGYGYDHGAEWWDVSIRCYLLNETLSAIVEELTEE